MKLTFQKCEKCLSLRMKALLTEGTERIPRGKHIPQEELKRSIKICKNYEGHMASEGIRIMGVQS